MADVIIHPVSREASPHEVAGLAALLIDAVDSGAGVSFMRDLTVAQAEAWWRSVLASSSPRAIILTASDERGVVGTVQVQPSWAPNQPHRGDVAKLMVHRRAQGRGIARKLMTTIEHRAAQAGFTLLVLDTVKGSAAERLYTGLDWTRVGEVPDFALNPDGSLCDTVFFYKRLSA
jgi:GNAT superfamily N-acetyltransferase